MQSSFVSVFRKRISCPSSEALLAYRRSCLDSKETATIETHLAGCDFCSAELQLLTRHRNQSEEYALAEMPAQLRRLAEDLLRRRRSPASFKEFTGLEENPQVSH